MPIGRFQVKAQQGGGWGAGNRSCWLREPRGESRKLLLKRGAPSSEVLLIQAGSSQDMAEWLHFKE